MRFLTKSFFLFAMSLSLLFFNSCETDDGEKVESDLIGTWTFGESTVEITVDGVDLVDFLVDMFDFSEMEAETFTDYYAEDYGDTESGTITFKDDKTYQIQFDDGVENGTWSISSDGKTLTVTEVDDDGTSSVDNLTIKSLTSSLLVLVVPGETEEVDFNSDGVDDATLEISVEINLTK